VLLNTDKSGNVGQTATVKAAPNGGRHRRHQGKVALAHQISISTS
jgi:hypothetical protein